MTKYSPVLWYFFFLMGAVLILLFFGGAGKEGFTLDDESETESGTEDSDEEFIEADEAAADDLALPTGAYVNQQAVTGENGGPLPVAAAEFGGSKSASMRRRILGTGRRTRLPAMAQATGMNLWNLLCKNIGKDLSKIPIPVNFSGLDCTL